MKSHVALVDRSFQPSEDPSSLFLRKHPEGIVLSDSLRKQIAMAVREEDLPIVIEGETGTGKEQIMRCIHKQLKRGRDVPLVVLNCANLSKELALATLFGHKKGAFTGAVENSVGAVGRAHNGILFLDEFHRLDASIQEQILRTMQDGSYQRVGDSVDLHSNFRLAIATPKSLEQHALEGRILMDLRFRLYGIEIRIPPLRERLSQMGDFIDCFISQSTRPVSLSAGEKSLLIRRCSEFHWQGNIRQLFGVLTLLTIHAAAEGKPLLAVDLPVHPTMLPPSSALPSPQELSRPLRQSDSELVDLVLSFTRKPGSYDAFLDAFERKLLIELSSRYASVKGLCEALEIPRSTYFAKKQRLGLGSR